jgi:hypothetical protein
MPTTLQDMRVTGLYNKNRPQLGAVAGAAPQDMRTTGLYDKTKPQLGAVAGAAPQDMRTTGLYDKTKPQLGAFIGSAPASFMRTQSIDPSTLTGTNKAFYDAQQLLGTPQNTAQLNAPQIDQSLNPQAIQQGQLTSQQRAGLMGAESLSALYGNIDYDRSAIEGIFNAATDAEFAAKQAAYDRSANKYYDKLGTSQNAYLDAMRRSRAGAITSGVNAGIQNAQELSALLGMSQQTAADATQLAQDQRALSDQYAAAKAGNAQKALEYANATKLQLGTLGANVYGVDAQQYAAELGHNAQVQAANTAAGAQAYASDRGLQGTKFNAEANLAGQKYASDSAYNSSIYNTQGNLYGNMYGSDQNLAGTKYAADQSLKGMQAQAAATRAAAASSAAAARYAADRNLEAQGLINTTSVINTLVNARPNDLTIIAGAISTAFPGMKDE